MPIVRAGDADVFYEIRGEGDPLLMIMGLAADSRMWMLQTPAFSASYRIITFDNRGVGRSSSPPGPYTMEQMAADALAVLDASGVERAHVLGISMGGAIAQHLALKAPERVGTLVLAATWCHRNPYLDRMSALGRLIADSLGQEALVRASMLWLFTPRFFLERERVISALEQMALAFQPPVSTFVNQTAAVAAHDVREQLAAVTAPALVLVGRQDILVPPELAEVLAASIPGATLRILDGGHAFNVENAEEFNRTVLDFLAAQRR